MRYVLDASVGLCWVIPRPLSPNALQLRDDFRKSIHELIAPALFPGEIASGLTKAERQRLIAAVAGVLDPPADSVPARSAFLPRRRHLFTDAGRFLRLSLRCPRRAGKLRAGYGGRQAHQCSPGAVLLHRIAGSASLITQNTTS